MYNAPWIYKLECGLQAWRAPEKADGGMPRPPPPTSYPFGKLPPIRPHERIGIIYVRIYRSVHSIYTIIYNSNTPSDRKLELSLHKWLPFHTDRGY